ncbi:hypothetical protein ACQEVB_40765 [Pseudonocardia sp. CA-107938]|uniref:hypothetical protein n=1 Tax=Pseudonocardia sp. CA-107938 TaxID=3240021 RepID=UPI003D8CA861
MRLTAAVSAVVLAILAGCSAAPAPTAAPGQRIIREDRMPQYLDQLLKLYQADPKYGYVYRDGWDEVSRHNAELSGRQMCALIIAGIDPDEAYGAAYPAVKEAGNISAEDKQSGAVAAQVLCPKS